MKAIYKLQKYSQQNIEDLKFIKGWADDYGNVTALFDIGGKKFAFLGDPKKDISEWHYCFGIGTKRPIPSMPAGRADYLIGEKLEGDYSRVITEFFKHENPSFIRLPNKVGVSWTPKNDAEKIALANMVGLYCWINRDLKANGITYPNNDRLIYGDDISKQTVLDWTLTPTAQQPQLEQKFPTQSMATGNSENVEKFIVALSSKYKAAFGRDMVVTSTFRNPLQQAKAMTYPLGSGDYDKLYSHIGPKSDQIKNLIIKNDFESAAEVIKTTSLMNGSHMNEKAIDVGFNSNGLSTSDYDKFKALVAETSRTSGIPAKINFEKSTHFHISVG